MDKNVQNVATVHIIYAVYTASGEVQPNDVTVQLARYARRWPDVSDFDVSD